MVDWGLKISKSGFDVKTTDGKNLSFTSGGRIFKVHMEGIASVTGEEGGTYVSVEITHDLNYFPIHLVFIIVDDSEAHISPQISYSIKVNSTKLFIDSLFPLQEGETEDYRYYIFKDEGI